MGLSLGEQSVNVLANDFIALTASFFEAGTIDDVNAAVMGVDQPGIMQVANDPRHSRSLHAKHFPKKFLCEWYRVAVRPVACLE